MIEINLPVQIDCNNDISEQSILEIKKRDVDVDLGKKNDNEIEIEIEIDLEEDILQDEDIGNAKVAVPDNDWIYRVMTMPWKELYIDYLQKEGWTWYYEKRSGFE